MGCTLRNKLFENLLQKDIEYFDQHRSGELISRLSSDISTINKGASDAASTILKNTVQIIGSLILKFLISWNIALVLFCVIPPFTITAILFVQSYKILKKEYSHAAAQATQTASEVLCNMKIIKSFSTEEKETLKYKNVTQNVYLIGYKISILGSQFMFIGLLLAYIIILAILYCGGILVINGELSIGDFSSFGLYTLTMRISLLSMSDSIKDMVSALASFEKINSIIKQPNKMQNGIQNANNVNGEITIKNVTFNYPTKQNVIALRSVNLEIKQGEVVAIVGQNGSGKSTLVSLLQRFYDIQQGQILFNKIDIKEYNLQQL